MSALQVKDNISQIINSMSMDTYTRLDHFECVKNFISLRGEYSNMKEFALLIGTTIFIEGKWVYFQGQQLCHLHFVLFSTGINHIFNGKIIPLGGWIHIPRKQNKVKSNSPAPGGRRGNSC